MSGKLLSVKMLAERWDVHPNTVKNLPIPFTKVGRQRRYHPKAVEKYEADHSPRPKAWRESAA